MSFLLLLTLIGIFIIFIQFCNQSHRPDKNNKADLVKYENNITLEDIITEVIKKGYKIKIVYQSGTLHNNAEITERIIKPIEIKYGKEIYDNKLIHNSQYARDKIFIKAFCELRQAERHFRLDRLQILSIITV